MARITLAACIFCDQNKYFIHKFNWFDFARFVLNFRCMTCLVGGRRGGRGHLINFFDFGGIGQNMWSGSGLIKVLHMSCRDI